MPWLARLGGMPGDIEEDARRLYEEAAHQTLQSKAILNISGLSPRMLRHLDNNSTHARQN